MTKRKSGLAGLLAALCLVSLTGCGGKAEVAESPARTGELAALSDEAYFEQEFSPVVRFVVASDVHVADLNSQQEEQRLADLFAVAYDYAAGQENYTGLDGVFFAGDVSDRGTPFSLQKFFSIVEENVREGTVVRATMGNHEYYDNAELAEYRFLTASGYESTDAHLEVGGYHFIFLSPDKGGKGYSGEKQDFLADALEEAAKDDPTGRKPIFVLQHHHVKKTVLGSGRWGVEDLKDILKKYPQVIDFSGHSHFPISDPRSVWQKEFTALGTGTLSYYEMDMAGVYDDYIFPTDRDGGWADSATGERDAAQFYIVEVDANHAVKVQGYDLLSGDWMIEPIFIRSVGDTSEFVYTAARYETAQPPVFSADAAVTLEEVSGDKVTLRFPQAEGDHVQHYQCALYCGDERVYFALRLACTDFRPVPETISVTFERLEKGKTYTAEIVAVSAFEKKSQPLTFEMTMTEPGQFLEGA